MVIRSRRPGNAVVAKTDWRRLQWPRLLREGVLALLLLLGVVLGKLGFPLLLIGYLLECWLLQVYTQRLYRKHQHSQGAGAGLKFAALLFFLALFQLSYYLLAGGWRGEFRIDVTGIGWLALAYAVHIGWQYRVALRCGDGPLSWTRTQMAQAAVLFATLLIGVFVGLAGLLLAVLLVVWLPPPRNADLAMSLCFLATYLWQVALLSTISDEELRHIARQPFLRG